MDKTDIQFLLGIIHDYGVDGAIAGLIEALEIEAGFASDLGLKEKSIQAANMAEALRILLEK
jgi:hypothetical protein